MKSLPVREIGLDERAALFHFLNCFIALIADTPVKGAVT